MEFLILLIVTLAIAVVVAGLVIFFFKNPMDKIFARIIGEEISTAWRKFLTFALFVVGVSSGVNYNRLEKFIQPETDTMSRPILTIQYWGLEIYRTIINTLGGLAWALLLFFIAALIAFVIIKRGEGRAKTE